jgi:Na+(H+)/acetate symporter ActP
MGRWLTIVLVVLYLCTIPIPTCYHGTGFISVPGSDFAAAAAATMPMLILCMFLPSIDSSAGG